MAPENFTNQQAILNQVIERTGQVFFIYHPHSHSLVYISNAFEQLWGRSPASVQANPDLLLNSIHPEDQEYVRNEYQRLLTQATQQLIEFRITLPNQTVKWIRVAAFRVEEAGTSVVTGLAWDISKEKEFNLTLMKFNSKKNSLLHILSHDLSAPFATIQGMAALAQGRLNADNIGQVNKFLQIIFDISRRGIKLIRDFVTQESLETAEIALNIERVDLVDRIKLHLEEYKIASEELSKRFIFTYTYAPMFAQVDEMKFMQVVTNLVGNAVKFTPDHGTISLRLEDQEDSVLLSVKDTGIGIPAELQPFLFDKFSKARRSGVRGEETTGLGLAISKTIVELHKGRIWVESKENQGATFYVQIPKNAL